MALTDHVARAVHSGNLKVNLSGGCNVDVIIAMGWVAKHNAGGIAVLRHWCGDETAVATVTQAALEYAIKHRKHYPVRKADKWWDRFAATAVKHWAEPVCPHCHGRRYKVIAGTPTLSDEVCMVCNGSGQRKAPRIGQERMDSREWKQLWQGVMNHLDDRQQSALRAMKHVLTGG